MGMAAGHHGGDGGYHTQAMLYPTYLARTSDIAGGMLPLHGKSQEAERMMGVVRVTSREGAETGLCCECGEFLSCKMTSH
jgi:hypothetical protein